jgi:hypothetical protein
MTPRRLARSFGQRISKVAVGSQSADQALKVGLGP